MSETLHIGRKISRIRELRGMKQEALAAELGISQQQVSKIEQTPDVEDAVLNKIAVALGVTSDAIKAFTEESVFNYFNTFHDHSGAGAWSSHGTFNFNPIDKLIEVFEENKKLYEQLLASERDKVELLKQNKANWTISKPKAVGNYKELEYEFIERTLALIDQYEIDLKNYAFKEQYNYTLLINCLTGIIVMPKEKTIDVIPNDRLLSQMKIDMGLAKSTINSDFKTVKEFAISLRHCVAHFSIKIESETPEFLIDNIIFYDNEKGAGYEVANFAAEELLPFIKYYASWLLVNLQLKAKHVKRGTSRVRHN